MAEVALNVSNGLEVSSEAEAAGWGGVAKSIRTPSWLLASVLPFWLDVFRAGVRRRVSSKDGMLRTGETGTVGLRIDFRGKEAVDYKYCKSISLISKTRADNSGITYLSTITIRIL